MEQQNLPLGSYRLELRVAMPCAPGELNLQRYVIPGLLDDGDKSAEEAAVRIVSLCQQAGIWCGVTHMNLAAQVAQDTVNDDAYRKAVANYRTSLKAYRRYWWRSLLTFGLYRLWVPVLTRPKEPVEPYSALLQGVGEGDPISIGIDSLLVRDLITQRFDDRTGEEVLYPTAALARRMRRLSR